MPAAPYVVLGRKPDCDVVMPVGAVSGRHARLSWQRSELWLEDLGSANGTFVDGERIRAPSRIQIGQDVRFGTEALPWADERLRTFLRHGASDTIVAMPRFGRFKCPKCQKHGILPAGFKTGEIVCSHCQTSLFFGDARRSRGGAVLTFFGTVLVGGAVVAAFLLFATPWGRTILGGDASGAPIVTFPVPVLGDPTEPRLPPLLPSHTPGGASAEERAIRDSGTAARILEAVDPATPTTRNRAVQVASETDGPFHVEQVAAIWMHVRAEFDYVNDPRGSEYFARASETIDNGYAGDCDDFATTLSAMSSAIGGRARIVMMDGPDGGHAYAEVCIDDDAEAVARRLRTYVRAHWDRRLGRRPTLTAIHYRTDTACPTWLNLDWNANYPGGPYAEERWAVAIDLERGTETLTPFHVAPGASP